MTVLGLSAFYHDSAACLVQGGRVVAAAQEERFSRVRFDAEMPWRAIQSCLELGGIGMNDVEVVSFYEKPLLRFDRAMTTFVHRWPAGRRAFSATAADWFRQRLRLKALLHSELGWRGRVVYAAHHEAHAASAFLASPFEEAAILTIDGVGEWTTNAVGLGRGADVSLLQELRFPHSLGLLYAAVTEYLGFEVLADEYKVMGLAPYGKPRFAEAIKQQLVTLRQDGSYELDLAYFRYLDGDQSCDPARFAALFEGKARAPSDPLEDRHADVAASVQAVIEEALLLQARHAHRVTGAENLVMAGGVSLNSVANGRIAREGPFKRLWIQPAAGDAGGALGAALLGWHRALGKPRSPLPEDSMQGALLGPSFDERQVALAVQDAGLSARQLPADELDAEVAKRLASGAVAGWFQGRMEFGPRALGARSILADPRALDVQARVNERIKFREGFRPFAPAVLERCAKDWFQLDGASPYMLLVTPVAAAHARAVTAGADADAPRGLARLGIPVSDIPGVTHVDGSARVQTVDAQRNPRFFRLLTAFEAETGCPLLLNTSFNLRGEPIVCTPANAIHTFLASGLDLLVLGSSIVERPPGPAVPLPPPPAKARSRVALKRFARDLALGFALISAVLWFKGGVSARPFTAAFGALALGMAAVAQFRRHWLGPLLAVWQPFADRLGRGLSGVLFGAVYWLVVGPIALLRRVSAEPWPAPRNPALPSYWSTWQPPRGDTERMY